MSKRRRKISPEKKVEIIREHLDNKKSISELAELYDIHPNLISKWKKELFEGAAVIFSRSENIVDKKKEEKLKRLEETLQKRDSIIAEIIADNIQLKKNDIGES
ncbi:MAG: transposase [Methanomicrobiaceae archaeon]|nr:transposase [Methanomicrobiaceae archaeon]